MFIKQDVKNDKSDNILILNNINELLLIIKVLLKCDKRGE